MTALNIARDLDRMEREQENAGHSIGEPFEPYEVKEANGEKDKEDLPAEHTKAQKNCSSVMMMMGNKATKNSPQYSNCPPPPNSSGGSSRSSSSKLPKNGGKISVEPIVHVVAMASNDSSSIGSSSNNEVAIATPVGHHKASSPGQRRGRSASGDHDQDSADLGAAPAAVAVDSPSSSNKRANESSTASASGGPPGGPGGPGGSPSTSSVEAHVVRISNI